MSVCVCDVRLPALTISRRLPGGDRDAHHPHGTPRSGRSSALPEGRREQPGRDFALGDLPDAVSIVAHSSQNQPVLGCVGEIASIRESPPTTNAHASGLFALRLF